MCCMCSSGMQYVAVWCVVVCFCYNMNRALCVAVCCSVLQCVAVCCSVLFTSAFLLIYKHVMRVWVQVYMCVCVACVVVSCSMLQCGTVYCSVLQCVVVRCRVLQGVAGCCSVL